jgi:hypothetical protein
VLLLLFLLLLFYYYSYCYCYLFETISSLFEVLSDVPQGSVLGLLLFNVYINDLCDSIKHSRYLLFADDIKIYRVVSSPEDCNLLQSDVDSIRSWCAANYMKLNVGKTRVITFYKKTNSLIYEYKLFHSTVTRSYSTKGLGVYLIVNFIFMITLILYFHSVLRC